MKHRYLALVLIAVLLESCGSQPHKLTPFMNTQPTEMVSVGPSEVVVPHSVKTVLASDQIIMTPILTPNATSYSNMDSNPLVVMQKVIDSKMEGRIANGAKDLAVSLKFLGIQASDNPRFPFAISISMDFYNATNRTIVFKFPRRIGFLPLGNISPYTDLSMNDISIFIRRKDDSSIEVTSSSQRLTREYFDLTEGGSLANYLYHRPEHFGEIGPGKVISYRFICYLPTIILEGDYLSTRTPSGTYVLWAEYANLSVGYNYPIVDNPNMTLEDLSDPNAMIADINAWVGKAITNEVELYIP